jgi:hypothetical protein
VVKKTLKKGQLVSQLVDLKRWLVKIDKQTNLIKPVKNKVYTKVEHTPCSHLIDLKNLLVSYRATENIFCPFIWEIMA